MKTRLLLIVTLLVAGIAAWYFFLGRPKTQGQVEQLIPRTSLGVLTVQNPRAFLNESEQYDWWDEVLNLPLLAQMNAAVEKLDSLNISTDLGKLPLHISIHKTRNDQLEALYFIKAKGFNWQQASVEEIARRIFGSENLQINARNYLDYELYELTSDKGSFSFLIEGKYLALSTNALLVEDVVRAVEQDSNLLTDIPYRVADESDELSLFLVCHKLEDLASVFFTGDPKLNVNNGLYLKLAIEASASGLRVNGSSIFTGNFISERESGLNLKNFVPANASVVKWFGLEDVTQKGLNSFDLKAFNALNTGDLCLLDLDINNQDTDHVLLTTLTDIDLGKQKLTELAESLMVQNDTLFRESFMDTEIIFVNQKDLPTVLFGHQFNGFEQTYFSTYNDVLLFGSSIDALKSVLLEYDAENTWGRSIEKRRFIDDMVQEASLTAIYNFEYLQESLKGELRTNWQQFFDERPGLINAIDLFSMQLSNTGSGVLMSAAVDFNESVSRKTQVSSTDKPVETVSKLEAAVNAFADTTLSTKSYLVRNHNNNQRELVFQDVSHQLYLVTDQGLVQWKKSIDGAIRGDISQIDYYNNRKLQYLFMTDKAIHVVDRNGDDVEGFPKSISAELPPEGHRVVDYDNTKRYRYATADRRGNVYLYNKEGSQLEGWNPKVIGSQLLDLPEHVRIRGRDCFLMVERQGTVHLTNRRGEYYPGFPYNANKRLAGETLIVRGSDFSRSRIVVVSENGEILNLDFEGKVVSRNQLLRPNARSTFRLVRDKLNNGFVVVRQDRDQSTIFDQNGKEMFQVSQTAPDNIDYSFYNFRNDSEVLVMHDRVRQKSTLYNSEGDALLGQDLNASAPIGIIYYQSRGEYELFVNFANQMAIYKVAK